VNFYDNAEEVRQAAIILYENAHYRMSIYNSCLSIELYLKSKLYLMENGDDYVYTHDTVNMYQLLTKRFKFDKDIFSIIKTCRKYFNESRYPHAGTEVYTKEFAKEFLGNVESVKSFIDNDCVADITDLENKG